MSVRKFREGERIVGTMIRMVRNPAIARIAYDAGLDFIMLDMEHGPYSVESFSDVAKVARAVGIGIFVRVPELSKGYVSRLMDAGADGVMVPMLNTEAEAKRLVDLSRYAPIGRRGLSTSGVHNNFRDFGDDTSEFMKRQNENTLAIAQIETSEAIENVEKIAAVEGIDIMLIGPQDLAASYGVPGEILGSKIQDAIERVFEAARKNGKGFSMHSGKELLDIWEPKGMQMVMTTQDINILKSGLTSIVKKYGRA